MLGFTWRPLHIKPIYKIIEIIVGNYVLNAHSFGGPLIIRNTGKREKN